MTEPTPTEVFNTYWRFAAERQRVFFAMLAGRPAPWTADPVISAYRFTNAYRASDRVSQYLLREVQYNETRLQYPRDLFLRTLLFKIFNRIETWEALEAALGPIESITVSPESISSVLQAMMDRGEAIYSAAYIMSSPPFGHKRKHDNHLALLQKMMDDHLPERLQQLPDLKSVYEVILAYPGIGRFLAFQYAIDLNYSLLLDHDEKDFVVAGPGALDGISKCFADTADMNPEEIIHWTTDRQEQEFARLGIDFPDLFGRRLQPIDCQNLFCEISKYARVAHPDVQGVAGRSKIKQSYKPLGTALPAPFYPPRWGINEAALSWQTASQSRLLRDPKEA